MSTDKTKTSDLFKYLKNSTSCQRCTLRHLGVREPKIFQSVSQVKEKLSEYDDKTTEEEKPLVKKTRLAECCSCLGVLDDLCSETSLFKLKEAIENSEFEFSDLQLALNIPASFLIRERGILLHLKKTFPDAIEDIDKIPSIKEVWKWVAGKFLENEFNVKFSVPSDFDVNVTIAFPEDLKEIQNILKLVDVETKNRKSKNHGYKASVERALAALKDDEIIKHVGWPPNIPSTPCAYEPIVCKSKPLYLAGRYNKYSRELSQTPWVIEGEKKVKSSVQEKIYARLLPKIPADEVVFSSSGREDVDVRTLGRGRPFVLEFINPKKRNFTKEELAKFQQEVNSSTTEIAIRDLQIVFRDDLSNLKMGEEKKKKQYSALCYSPSPIDQECLEKLNTVTNLTLKQKTPIRVLHRRPLAIRDKMIHDMTATLIDDHHFSLKVTTQAGTYVKEFVHGDFGRTVPNIGTLLEVDVDILELDVEAILLDWPPTIHETNDITVS